YCHLVRGTRMRWFPDIAGAVAEELDGAGRLALVEAARDYEGNRGAGFATFAIWRLRDAMRNERRRHERWSRAEAPLDAAPDADEIGAPLQYQEGAPGPLDQALRRDARRMLLAAVNGLPWVEREV